MKDIFDSALTEVLGYSDDRAAYAANARLQWTTFYANVHNPMTTAETTQYNLLMSTYGPADSDIEAKYSALISDAATTGFSQGASSTFDWWLSLPGNIIGKVFSAFTFSTWIIILIVFSIIVLFYLDKLGVNFKGKTK